MRQGRLPILVTVNNVTEKYGIPKRTVYGWIKTNQITYYRFGIRTIRFDVKEIERLVKNQKRVN